MLEAKTRPVLTSLPLCISAIFFVFLFFFLGKCVSFVILLRFLYWLKKPWLLPMWTADQSENMYCGFVTAGTDEIKLLMCNVSQTFVFCWIVCTIGNIRSASYSLHGPLVYSSLFRFLRSHVKCGQSKVICQRSQRTAGGGVLSHNVSSCPRSNNPNNVNKEDSRPKTRTDIIVLFQTGCRFIEAICVKPASPRDRLTDAAIIDCNSLHLMYSMRPKIKRMFLGLGVARWPSG